MTKNPDIYTPPPGMAIDSRGGPVVDPTKNVLDLVDASVKRIDDMSALQGQINLERFDAIRRESELRAMHEMAIAQMREGYQEKLARAESGRLDSIRQVDREEVAKTAVAANMAISTLAKQTTDLQQTLAKQVTDTATAQEARNSAQYSDINKRLSALELSSSEGKGKQQVADPQMDKLTALVEQLARTQVLGSGERRGSGDTIRWIALGITMVVGLILIGTFVFVTQRGSAIIPAPQVIVVPAGTTAPGAVQTGPATGVTR